MALKEIEWLWQSLKNPKCHHHSIRLVDKLIECEAQLLFV